MDRYITMNAYRTRFSNTGGVGCTAPRLPMQSDRAHSDARPATNDDGAATAEYAIATMAAVGFAGLLVVIMRSEEVRGILTDLVHRALTFAG